MKEARDFQRGLVYKSEDQAFDKRKEPEFQTIEQCYLVVDKIINCNYWKSYNGVKKIYIKDGRGRRRACAWSKGIHGKRNEISLPKWSRSTWIIIHECAHILTSKTDKGTAPHGAVFCTHYVNLVGQILGYYAQSLLESRFDENGVKVIKQREAA